MKQENPAAIDGVAELVDLGNAPFWAVVRYGNAAVPALVRVARADPWRFEQKLQRSMDALEQMLESATIRPTLSASSRAAIRQVAADRMRTLKGDENWRNLAAAVYLAVAAGDPQLRNDATDLIDNDAEFFRRAMNVRSQQEVSDLVRQALAKFRSKICLRVLSDSTTASLRIKRGHGCGSAI